MSQFTDFAASLTAHQVDFVKQGQDVVLAGLRKAIADAPETPEAVRNLTSDFAARQVEFVAQGQDALFAAVSSALESLPEAPEVQVPEQFADSFKSVTSIVGTPAELKAVLVETGKTWVAVNKDFSTKVVAELAKTA